MPPHRRPPTPERGPHGDRRRRMTAPPAGSVADGVVEEVGHDSVSSRDDASTSACVESAGHVHALRLRHGTGGGHRLGHDLAERHPLEVEVEAGGLDAGQLEQIVHEAAEADDVVRSAVRSTARISAGSATTPSSSASTMAWIPAIGVRRSWLTQATSSRRLRSTARSRAVASAASSRLRPARRPDGARRARRPRRHRRSPHRAPTGRGVDTNMARAAVIVPSIRARMGTTATTSGWRVRRNNEEPTT